MIRELLTTAKRRLFSHKQAPTAEQVRMWHREEAMGIQMRSFVETEGWKAVATALTVKIARYSDLTTIEDEAELKLRQARVQELQSVLDLPKALMANGERAAQALAALQEGDAHGG